MKVLPKKQTLKRWIVKFQQFIKQQKHQLIDWLDKFDKKNNENTHFV